MARTTPSLRVAHGFLWRRGLELDGNPSQILVHLECGVAGVLVRLVKVVNSPFGFRIRRADRDSLQRWASLVFWAKYLASSAIAVAES